MKNEIMMVSMVALLAFLIKDTSVIQSSFKLTEVLVSLTFALVFIFSIGLEVVDEK